MGNIKSLMVLIGIVALSGCQLEQVQQKAPEPSFESVTIDAPISDFVREFKGQVVPAELTHLSFRLDGELQQLKVKPGDQVSAGQVLASLDVDKIEQEIIDLKAQKSLADRQLKRARELSKNNMISASDIDALTANQKLSTIRLKSAQRRLDFSSLRAPFDGVISQVPLQNYERVSPGVPVVSIYKDQLLYVRLSVSDTVLALINPNPNPDLYQPKARFEGRTQSYALNYLEHTSERHPETQNYEVWLQMPQPQSPILPGTAVTIEVDLLQSNPNLPLGFEVPLSVLVAGKSSGQFKVWKVVDGQAKSVDVEIGRVNSNGALIIDGVAQSDVLLSSKLRSVREGQSVLLKEGTL